jgi:MFS family permease
MRMVQPFLVVYAVNVIELTKTRWGVIQTALGIISAVLALPGGMFSDRFGRRLSILIARFLSPFNWISLFLLRDFNQLLLLQVLIGIGIGLSGGGDIAMGGPAWNALVADLVPSSDRGKVMGLMSMVSGIVGMPSSIIGGYIWTSFSPDTLLASSFFAGLVPLLIFYLFVKEPKIRER